MGHLRYVISSGLASDSRRTWLVEKGSLEARKRAIKGEWEELSARQRKTTEAFEQLEDKAAAGGAEGRAKASSALALSSQWSSSQA